MITPCTKTASASRAWLRTALITLSALLAMSLVKDVAAQTYEGRDEYRNLIFTLILNQDHSYTIEEMFLDGSSWVDSGSWTKTDNEISLRSFGKTQRMHNQLKFKKTVKFKDDVFRIEGNKLYYTNRGNKKLNGHYSMLVIHRLPTPPAPLDTAVE